MNKPSRRAVVRTGVWTVPVVAAAAAAPALATSGGGCTADVCISPSAVSCKFPGKSTDTEFGYRLVLVFTNNTTSDQTVVITQFVTTGTQVKDNFAPTDPFVVPAGTYDSTGTFVPGTLSKVFIVTSTNSQEKTATVFYTVNGVPAIQPISLTSFKPCKCGKGDPDIYDPATTC